MNRRTYFDSIEEVLSHLITRLELRGRLNILDLHLHAENFYLNFFNLLFTLQLKNINLIKQNTAGIDLVDVTNRIVVQVSTTATKQKVESALSKDLSSYQGYTFYFIAIVTNADKLRTLNFINPHGLSFSPIDHIYDANIILRKIQGESIEQQERIFNFLKKEIRRKADPEKVETNLAAIIKILSKESWNFDTFEIEKIPFDVEEKIPFNVLDKSRYYIDEHKIHYSRIDKIYSEFNRLGTNKSLSILNGIRKEYISLKDTGSSDQVFFQIIENVISRVRRSSNYIPLAEEELEVCVQILVVDSFIRCKIFENPMKNTHAHS